MPVILTATANVASLTSPDLYVQIQNPPGYIVGVATDVFGIVGTASWGPLNTPVLLGNGVDAVRNFGPVTSAAVSGGASGAADLHDLATELALAFAQAQGSTLQGWGVRVSDGTDVKATSSLKDSAGTTGATITAIFSGIMGNQITWQFTAGSKGATFFNITLGTFPGGPDAEFFPNIAGGSAGVFWTNITSAINNGISGIRGPSQLVRLTSPSGAALNPTTSGANSTGTLSTGTDGRTTITVNQQLGSDTSLPKTGIYSFRGLTPAPSVAWCAGLIDNASSTAQALANFGDSEAIVMAYSNPAGVSTATAISNKLTWAIDTYNLLCLKDHVFVFDGVNNLLRLLPPYAPICGRTCTLSAEVSPLNKQVYGVSGTERTDPTLGTQPYSPAEIGQLHQNGILFIYKPIPGGNVFGIRSGTNASNDPVKSPVEFGRYTNKLARTLAGSLGKYVGQNQSTKPNDPLRNSVLLDLNSFLGDEAAAGRLDSFVAICDLTNNSASTIAKHYLYALVRVRYLASVWYFVVGLQGGTTVVAMGASPGQAMS